MNNIYCKNLILQECTQASKERRKALRNSHDPSLNRSGTKASVNSSFEDWVIARNKIGNYALIIIKKGSLQFYYFNHILGTLTVNKHYKLMSQVCNFQATYTLAC